jgi:transposase
MTNAQVEISSERIDDIPLIVEWLKQMGIAKVIDQSINKPQVNHQGMSYGQLSVLVLTYIITQADHRLCAVEPWVKTQRKILELTTGWKIGEKDTTDDRLARVVEEIGKQEEACSQIERKIGRNMLSAYQLPTEVARADTSSFSVNHQPTEPEEERLLRYGYSKDKRPDLLQYRQLLGTLDPTGIPLVSSTLPGNGADDPLYYPTWERMSKVIGHKDFVFLADAKAGALATRGQIAAAGGLYCFPLPMTGQTPQFLQQWVLNPSSPSTEIRLPNQTSEEPAVGKGFEVELGKFWFNQETEKWVRWTERHLVVYSNSLAKAAIKRLNERLDKATTALLQLAAKPPDNLEQLQTKVELLLKRYKVKQFFCLTTTEALVTETRYLRRGRPTANSLTETVSMMQLGLEFKLRLSCLRSRVNYANSSNLTPLTEQYCPPSGYTYCSSSTTPSLSPGLV